MREYTQLTEVQKYHISALKKEGLNQQEIARLSAQLSSV